MKNIHLGNYKKRKWSFNNKFILKHNDFFYKNSIIIGSQGTGKTQFSFNVIEEIIINKSQFIYFGTHNYNNSIICNIYENHHNNNGLIYIKEEEIEDLYKMVDRNKNILLKSNVFYNSNKFILINENIIKNIYMNKKDKKPLYIIIDDAFFQISQNITKEIERFNRKNIYFIFSIFDSSLLQNNFLNNFNFFIFKLEDAEKLTEFFNIKTTSILNSRDIRNSRAGEFFYFNGNQFDKHRRTMIFKKENYEKEEINLDKIGLKKQIFKDNIDKF